LAEKRHPKTRKSDLELIVGRLGGRHLLYEKTRPQEDPKWACRAIPREESLNLERDGGNDRQKRQFLEKENQIVQESAARMDSGERRAYAGKYGNRHHCHHDEERRSAARMQRRLETCVHDHERFARLVSADRLVLCPVVLKNAPNLWHAANCQKIANDHGQLHDTGHGLECRALDAPPKAEQAIRACCDCLRQSDDEADGDREREPRRRMTGAWSCAGQRIVVGAGPRDHRK
jgi:hypothetical protein